jgi:hypothetical protein
MYALAVLLVIGISLSLLHNPIVNCTVGFRSSDQPLSLHAASECLSFEVLAGVLIVIALVAAGLAVWFSLQRTAYYELKEH